MNPNQKIAKLRDQVESLEWSYSHTEKRLRDAEKTLSLALAGLALQPVLVAAAIYAALQ